MKPSVAKAHRAARWSLSRLHALARHKATHHSHYAIYVAYYLLELIRSNETSHTVIVGGILMFSVMYAITGE